MIVLVLVLIFLLIAVITFRRMCEDDVLPERCLIQCSHCKGSFPAFLKKAHPNRCPLCGTPL